MVVRTNIAFKIAKRIQLKFQYAHGFADVVIATVSVIQCVILDTYTQKKQEKNKTNSETILLRTMQTMSDDLKCMCSTNVQIDTLCNKSVRSSYHTYTVHQVHNSRVAVCVCVCVELTLRKRNEPHQTNQKQNRLPNANEKDKIFIK